MDYGSDTAYELTSEQPPMEDKPSAKPPEQKPKRVKKTLEQRIAAKEDELKKLKAQARKERRARERREAEKARAARNHRLIESAATIEAEANHVELDEYISRWLGRTLVRELDNNESDIARHVAERDAHKVGDGE